MIEKRDKYLEYSETSQARRRWLAAAGRWGVMGLITAAVGMLWKRNGIAGTRLESCADAEGRIGCRQCALLEGCGHPKALSAKQVISKIKDQI
jgi:hypothetical protein